MMKLQTDRFWFKTWPLSYGLPISYPSLSGVEEGGKKRIRRKSSRPNRPSKIQRSHHGVDQKGLVYRLGEQSYAGIRGGTSTRRCNKKSYKRCTACREGGGESAHTISLLHLLCRPRASPRREGWLIWLGTSQVLGSGLSVVAQQLDSGFLICSEDQK